MKFLFLYCLFVTVYAPAQLITNYVMIDKDSKVTGSVKKALYFIIIKKYNDSSFERLEYNFSGPRIRSTFYKDPDMKIKHGRTCQYNDSGSVIISGNYSDDKKSGAWFNNKLSMRSYFENDSLVSVKPYDSYKDTLDSNRPNKIEIESSYRGGVRAYKNFLSKNIKYPERAMKMQIQGTVVVQFIVDAEGKSYGGEINKSVEFSIDEEALRLINRMTEWEPAILDGKKVKSYKKQPITFGMQ